MKSITALLVISLFATSVADAQTRKKKPSHSRSTTSQATPAAPAIKSRIVGSSVVIITKNGDRISGELLDLTAYSVRIRANNLESTLALDTIASRSFGASAVPAARPDQQQDGSAHAGFARDADTALAFFQQMATNLKSGIDYTEYGRQLSELRRATERFVTKYSSSDNAAEARVVSLMAGAVTDYTWARTVWTLKFGRTSDGTVAETDSSAVTDTIATYPDLRAAAAAGNRLSVEKLIAGLWRKAAEKTDRARALASTPRSGEVSKPK